MKSVKKEIKNKIRNSANVSSVNINMITINSNSVSSVSDSWRLVWRAWHLFNIIREHDLVHLAVWNSVRENIEENNETS